MQYFNVFYVLLGGLGLFFYGMKAMSDSLQQAAGELIKRIINSLTSNRFLAVAVGCGITCIIQSSSITTVMVVGLVNAGLMKLTQAIGVIFGANIGTTITGWIISVKIGKYGLLLVGIGIFPMLFASRTRWKQLGHFLFGLGAIFLGLEFMSEAFKPLREMPEFLNSISYFSGNHYGAYIASMLVGCALTMIVQSSSAMLGITIALATTGVINFQTGAALVLGENIGTTITAILASITGNTNAKRAARAHATFNIIGVMIIMSIFPYYAKFIEWFVPGEANFVNAAGELPNVAVHIATVHTMFNVTATICFLPFIKYLAQFVTWLTPEKTNKEHHHLVVLGDPDELLPATALLQAEKELERMHGTVTNMFKMSREYLDGTNNNTTALAKIQDYEHITDNVQTEITLFVCKVMEKNLSPEQSRESQAIVRIADELESVADYLAKLVKYDDKFMQEAKLKSEHRQEFFDYFDQVEKFYHGILNGLHDVSEIDFSVVDRKSMELYTIGEDVKAKHIDRVSKGEYGPLSALSYSDMIMSIKKIRSHSQNIAEAMKRNYLPEAGE